ncbi:MAG TPA: substrate-binding domain-containing protein [Steroidobacteraceae bacterium]|nr:substrate-binding domain-containing protein [Steroidobacteraceae bacterium]
MSVTSSRVRRRALCAASLILTLVAVVQLAEPVRAAAMVAVDPSLPDYVPHQPVSGSIVGYSGMDTVEHMMAAWNAAFRKLQPHARFSAVQKDGLAPEDRIALGPRTMEVFDTTNRAYENAYGYEPFRIRICAGAYILKSHVSAIGVYVNKSNPLTSISLRQLDAVFSAERRRGYPADITTWGQLGLSGPWADEPVHIYGFYWRDDVTDYFRKLVMLDAPFKSSYEVPGGDMSRSTPKVAAAIMSALAQDPYGISFGNASYMTDQVKPLALSVNGVRSPFTFSEVASGRYPLQRYLYIYVNRKPGQPLDPLLKEFLRFVLSRQGQALVSKDQYLPLPAALDARELQKLN